MAGQEGAAAVRGASLLIVLQVGSRAATFVANQVLLRFLTAQLLGVSAQLEVYYLSVLFFARESLRVAIQRQAQPSASDGKARSDASSRARAAQSAVNAAYLAILLGALVALLLGWLYLASARGTAVAATPLLAPSLRLYAAAAVVELLAEPAFVVLQLRLRFGARAAAEALATLLRCAITLTASVWAARRGRDLGVLPFALGQLSYGAGLLLVYAYHGARLAREEGFALLPSRLAPPAAGFFDAAVLKLAASMSAQSLVKHVLTQGDTFMVSILSTPAAQGVYALVNNYGGLLARLVFQPVEESSRSYFSRLLAPGSAGRDPEAAPAAQASRDLLTILKIYTLFSTAVVALGPSASLLLSLVTGPRWSGSGAGETLAAYVWYIPLLAVNGVAEAFVASVATETEVHRQSAWMGVFSLVFAGAGFVFLRVLDMGATGLVVANCINMVCRIAWCFTFIRRYFQRLNVPFAIDGLRPGPVVFLAAVVTRQFVASLARTTAPEGARAQIVELVKMAGAAVPFILVLYVYDISPSPVFAVCVHHLRLTLELPTSAFSEHRFLRESYLHLRGRTAANGKSR